MLSSAGSGQRKPTSDIWTRKEGGAMKKTKMPKLKDVANAAVPRSYLTGWFSVGAKGGSAEAGQLADRWLKKNSDKLKA